MMENGKRNTNFSQNPFYGIPKGLRQDQTRRSRYEKPKQRININQEPKNSSSEEELKSEQSPEHLQKLHEASLSSFQKAIMHNRIKEVEEFIAKGMDVNCQFSSGWTALMYASNCAHPDVVACLLKNGADPNSSKDKYTSLMSACASVGSDEMRVLKSVGQLLDNGADVDLYDRYGMSPLMYAAREGRATVVQKLIEKNAAVNNQDSKGNSALMWAAQRGHTKVVRCLLEASADVDIEKTDGTTALYLALINKHDQRQRNVTGMTISAEEVFFVEVEIIAFEQKAELLKELANPIKQDFASISTDCSTPDSPSRSPFKSSETVPQRKLDLGDLSVSVSSPTRPLANSTETSSSKLQSESSGRKVDSASVPANPAATISRKPTSDASGMTALRNQGTVMSTTCGDLELFLMGLDLKDLIPLFHQRKIPFQEFLQMTESDLCQLGVFKADVRKRILDAINETHTKKFKSSSSVPLGHYNKKISCSEGVAMLSNLKRHLGFAESSVGYISDRINEDRHIVLDSPDPIHIRELCSSTEDALGSVGALYHELVGFRLQIQGISPGVPFIPEDLTSFKKVSKKSKVNWKRVLLLGGGALTCIMTISWLIKSVARPVVIPVIHPKLNS